MKNKLNIIAAALGCGIVVEVAILANTVENYNLEHYEPEEFEDIMHNIVIDKKDEELTNQYLLMEENLPEDFWKDNGQYLLQDEILNELEKLNYDIVEKEEDEYIRTSTRSIGGYYSSARHAIVVLDNEYSYSNGCHEYMHFLGGYNTKKLSNLNETLTELMSRAYLCPNEKNNSAYVNNFYYTFPLIRILGEDINRTYFQRDDQGLYDALSKYTNRSDELIDEYNYLCDNYSEYNRSLFVKGQDSFLKVHKQHLTNFWEIIDEMYENKYNKEAETDNSLNFFKYHTGVANVKYEGMSNSCTYFSIYNPFTDDEMYLQSLYRDTEYIIDIDGITYEKQDDNLKEVERPKELSK